MTTTQYNRYPFSEPGDYRIRIRGVLDPGWMDCLEEMQISTSRHARGEVVTTLSGRLQDQAALLGVLNLLYDLHCAILLVERVNEEAET
jgi:hypothetical protein